jgi:hypothetical protein
MTLKMKLLDYTLIGLLAGLPTMSVAQDAPPQSLAGTNALGESTPQVAATDDPMAKALSECTGDECHSGSYRQRVGPQLGDALASARTSFRFVKPS